MKGTLSIMDRTGHREVLWDTEQRGTKLDPAQADAEFWKLVDTGALAYDMVQDERIRDFDPEKHTNVLIVPQFVGG